MFPRISKISLPDSWREWLLSAMLPGVTLKAHREPQKAHNGGFIKSCKGHRAKSLKARASRRKAARKPA